MSSGSLIQRPGLEIKTWGHERMWGKRRPRIRGETVEQEATQGNHVLKAKWRREGCEGDCSGAPKKLEGKAGTLVKRH